MNQETDLFQTEESKVTDNVYGMEIGRAHV